MIVIEGINHLGITVSNLDTATTFYKELFDFDPLEKLSAPGQAYLRIGDSIVCLYEVEGYKNAESSKNRLSLYVDEDDFEDALDEIEKQQLVVVTGPENIRNGQSIVFLDPDGNQLELSYPQIF